MTAKNFIDMKGKRVGLLLVIDRADNNKWGKTQWNCLCSCGKMVIVTAHRLRTSTKSCGHFYYENRDFVRKNK
jgi:hypothetical protein